MSEHLAGPKSPSSPEMDSDGLDPDTVTEGELIAELERVAQEMAELDYIEPFVYVRDGRRHLPIFSSVKAAEKFTGEFSRRRNKVYPFKCLGVDGTTLCSLLCMCDVVVLNDSTDGEYVLTSDDVSLLRRTWAVSTPLL